jgi:hypothetical protein
MIEQHRTFPEVPSETILWQYMPLAKFLHLIRTETIHFHRIDDFPDKNEGMMTILDKKVFSHIASEKDIETYLQRDNKRHYVNCWIKCPHELALMWETYGNEGVAIRTTAANLRKAMEKDKKHCIRMIEVRYIDEKTEAAQTLGEPLNMLYFPTTKRRYFKQESEVRLLYENTDKITDNKGFNIKIDVKELIQEIRVYPNAPKYFYDMVKLETKELDVPIELSSI